MFLGETKKIIANTSSDIEEHLQKIGKKLHPFYRAQDIDKVRKLQEKNDGTDVLGA